MSVVGIGSVRSELNDEQPAVPRLVTRLHELLALLHGTGVLTTIDEIQDAIADDLPEFAGELTQGYPYLVQMIGYLAWNVAGDHEITRADVASLRAVPPRQREYLDAMAHIQYQTGQTTVSTTDLTTALDRPSTALSDTRGKLIDRDLIVAAGWGAVEFAQPYLGDYLRREQRPERVN
ncbi:ATPase [Corynebacterium cystitidis]|uniref:Uncharacterized protein n=2 Tax=Corynebacterium cystitidis TaxID=35757 RepID=A0A1H9P0G4_9CORY|nr:hypothetical protein SAMN05661109_00171 [Corynebacterium cystitidis DSM 20524]SNV72149.1 ATPase [Corynebacterium cystitidis]